MEFRLYKDLYTNDLSPKKIRRYRRRIEQAKPAITLQLVTMPLGREGLLEIYPYTMFLQKAYQEDSRPVYVLGLADSRDGALQVVETLILDMYQTTGGFEVEEFVKHRQG